MSAKKPQAIQTASHIPFGWWWLLGVAVLLISGGVWLMTLPGVGGDNPTVPDRKPADPVDGVLDRFRTQINASDRKALDLLGPEPVFDTRPVSEQEADARTADFYLRQPDLKIVGIRRGDPKVREKKGMAGNRYTLVTRVQGSTPPLSVRNDKGVVESPSRLFMINPDLVVEVKDGKIHGIRPELHVD